MLLSKILSQLCKIHGSFAKAHYIKGGSNCRVYIYSLHHSSSVSPNVSTALVTSCRWPPVCRLTRRLCPVCSGAPQCHQAAGVWTGEHEPVGAWKRLWMMMASFLAGEVFKKSSYISCKPLVFHKGKGSCVRRQRTQGISENKTQESKTQSHHSSSTNPFSNQRPLQDLSFLAVALATARVRGVPAGHAAGHAAPLGKAVHFVRGEALRQMQAEPTTNGRRRPAGVLKQGEVRCHLMGGLTHHGLWRLVIWVGFGGHILEHRTGMVSAGLYGLHWLHPGSKRGDAWKALGLENFFLRFGSFKIMIPASDLKTKMHGWPDTGIQG